MSSEISLLVVLTVIAVLAFWVIRLRDHAVVRAGSKDTLREFLHHFREREVPDDVLLTTYGQLQRWMSDTARKFPVRPTDSLSGIYGISAEEIEETTRGLLAACGRSWPAGESGFRGGPPDTVEALVLFVASCPPAAGGRESTPGSS